LLPKIVSVVTFKGEIVLGSQVVKEYIHIIKKQGVCQLHCGLAILHSKSILRQKEEELWKHLKYFTMQKYNLQKKSSKRHQIPSRYIYYNSIITNLKFQHKPKYHLSKINPHIKIDLLLFITYGPKSLKLLYTL
jgi:hypothetical protein